MLSLINSNYLLLFSYRAASAAICPAKLVTNVLRPVSSERSANSPVVAAERGDAITVAVV